MYKRTRFNRRAVYVRQRIKDTDSWPDIQRYRVIARTQLNEATCKNSRTIKIPNRSCKDIIIDQCESFVIYLSDTLGAKLTISLVLFSSYIIYLVFSSWLYQTWFKRLAGYGSSGQGKILFLSAILRGFREDCCAGVGTHFTFFTAHLFSKLLQRIANLHLRLSH